MHKKSILIILCTFCFSIQSFGQYKNRAVDLVLSYNRDGDLVCTAENADYCHHYLIFDFSLFGGFKSRESSPYRITVGKGRSEILTFKKMPNSSPTHKFSYHTFRGDINAKPNLDYIYTLPVKTGDSIQFVSVPNIDYTMGFNLSHSGDTVYACRAGIVCEHRLTDFSYKTKTQKERIIIYHKDKTFGEYSSYTKALVKAGDYVEAGAPIALMERPKDRFLLFSLYYLDKNKVVNENIGNKHSGLIPIFHTLNNGNIKLEEKTIYISEITTDLVTQEMSKKEKSKYEKKMMKK